MSDCPIAIVGMACRYPDASSPTELWQNVLARRRAFRRIPECRLPESYLGDRDAVDLAYVTKAAVLRDWEFDRERFGIPGPLYRTADHTHWLALETIADALADAGFPDGNGLDRDSAGVILGNSLTGEFNRAATLRLRWPFIADAAASALVDAGVPDAQASTVLRRLGQLVKQPFPEPGDELLTGTLANTIAGRACNHFDFHGTGYTVDGACSSSLLAVMTAANALTAGQLDFALAGGVDMSIDPLELVGFSRLGALADGMMRVYDERPSGFLPGEGCGVVALMRAEDAERLGVREYARILGWASSSDGAGGLSRPERAGQVLALTRAYQAAGVEPGDVGLIEGHGTGTAVGDQVELDALTTVRGRVEPAVLSTIKANIGHTKAAAGVAGLLKATQALYHRMLPPITGCERPHQMLREDSVPLRVLQHAEPWQEPTPRAGVSSMGFGGINAHLVLEATAERPPGNLVAVNRRWAAQPAGPEILFVGAGEQTELVARLDAIAESAKSLSIAELADVSATAWRDNGAYRFRAALVAQTPEELGTAAAQAAAAGRRSPGEICFDQRRGYALGGTTTPRIGLLFPGQAAPVRGRLPGWARHLAVPESPVTATEGDTDTAVAQPAIVYQSLAGLAWLRELGVEAVTAAGHSVGEITALHWAGSCSDNALLDLAGIRGRVMAEFGEHDTTMAGVRASDAELRPVIEDTGVVIAAHNAPDRIVISGSRTEIDLVLERARAAGMKATQLSVSHGFHSPAMLPAIEPFRDALAAFPIAANDTPIISTITGAELSSTGDELRELLVEQLTKPVLFQAAIDALAERCDLLVEVGPGTMLAALTEENPVTVPVLSMDTGGPAGAHAFLTAALAACAGADLEPWFADRMFRTLPWDAMPRFVVNPCENRAGWTEAQAIAEPAGATAEAAVDRVAVDAGEDPLGTLTQHLASVLELSADSIKPSSSMLGDLHLNSLQVVQLVGAVADALGRCPPDAPPPLFDATVADVAEVLAGLPPAQDETAPAGVGEWVRAFEQHWQPHDPIGAAPEEARSFRWSVHAAEGHWLHRIAGGGTGDFTGLAVELSEKDGSAEIAALLATVAEEKPDRLLVVHPGHPAAAGLARSVAAELGSCAVTVVDVPDNEPPPDLDALAGSRHSRYLELRRAPDGEIERATVSVRQPGSGAAMPLAEGDVCLVTGGVLGITAHVAVAFAERSGCSLVFAGRSAADDPEVADGLRAIRQRVGARYEQCDVADVAAVRALAASITGAGRVRGLIHGAGTNDPKVFGEVTADSLASTLRPKVDGITALLGELSSELRLVLGFGSIIGRQGLSGQSEYCIANDWLRVELERWGTANPGCRTHLLEWSLWSEIGMGVRLDVIDRLRRVGVEPISPERGVAALFEVLGDPDAPITLLLTSRFPATATLSPEADEVPSLRFAENTLAHVSGVEAILSARLEPGADPYLDDHQLDGVPVLPAVVGMEAMAQAASLAAGVDEQPSLTDLRFRSPVTVDDFGGREIRSAALTGSHGVDVVLRDDLDHFTGDRFTGTVVQAPEPPPPRRISTCPRDGTSSWYGSLFFHSGRFRRVAGYDRLSAFGVQAWLNAGDEQSWFSEFHSEQLLLGDPGTHDATLHALLACVPHRRALPVGVDRFTVWRKPVGAFQVVATERAHTADEYVFDVDLLGEDGAVAAGWRGLLLRAVGPLDWPDGLPADLVGPWLSRRLIECGIDNRLELRTAEGNGSPIRIAGTGREIGAASLAVDSSVAVDPADCEDVELLSDKADHDMALSAARVRAVRTILGEKGAGAPLCVDQVTEDGIVVARCGEHRLITARTQVYATDRPTVIALAEKEAA